MKSKAPFAHTVVLIAFLINTFRPIPAAQAQNFSLTAPGVMVHLSPEFSPAILKGIIIHPEDALKFDFIIYKGDQVLSDQDKKAEYTKLIKYFLASLAIPDDDQWVNLSPYEKNRIIKEDFGRTEMGRDLLAQDYMLKQITASLIYPQDKLGHEFWDKVYAMANQQFGTTNIPVNTFNKVWIVPDDAEVFEKGNMAYVAKNHLKVMLEEDYLSLNKHNGIETTATQYQNKAHTIGSQVVREIVLPALEREINEGKNFAPLRQVFSGVVLAAWYKRALKESFLGKVYMNKSHLQGVEQDPKNNQIIYQQYLKAFKKGVFNFIKEDIDKYSNATIPRKYFSGGVVTKEGNLRTVLPTQDRLAIATKALRNSDLVTDIFQPQTAPDRVTKGPDAAMNARSFSDGDWRLVNDAYHRFKEKYYQKLLFDDRFELKINTGSGGSNVVRIGSFSDAIERLETEMGEGESYIFEASDNDVMKELSDSKLDHLEWEFLLTRIKGTNEWIVSKIKNGPSPNLIEIDLTAIRKEISPEEIAEMLRNQKGTPHILFDIFIHNHPSGIALPSGQDLETLYQIAEEGNLKCFLRTPEGLTEVGIFGALNTLDADELRNLTYKERQSASRIRGAEYQRLERENKLFHKWYVAPGYVTLTTRKFEEKGESIFNVKDYQLSELLTSRSLMKQRWGMKIIAHLMGEEDVDLELRNLMVRMVSQIPSESIQMDYAKNFTYDFVEHGDEAVEHARSILETESTSPIIRAYMTVKQHDSIHREQSNRSFNEYVAPEYSWDAIKERAEKLPLKLKVSIQHMVPFHLYSGFEVAADLKSGEIEQIKELAPELLYLYLRKLFQMGHMRSGENDPLVEAAKYLNIVWGTSLDFSKLKVPPEEEVHRWEIPAELDYVTGKMSSIPIRNSALIPLDNGKIVNINYINIMQFTKDGKKYRVKMWDEGGFQKVLEKYNISTETKITFGVDAGGIEDSAMNSGIKNHIRSAQPATRSDLALLRKGGIDVNAAYLNLQIKRDGNGVPLPLVQQDMAQLNNLQGLEPVILKIQPAAESLFLTQILTTQLK